MFDGVGRRHFGDDDDDVGVLAVEVADLLLCELVVDADDKLPVPQDLRIERVAQQLGGWTDRVAVVFEEMSQQHHADVVCFRVANDVACDGNARVYQ